MPNTAQNAVPPELVAGRLHIGSIPGNGAEVLLDVPMNEEAPHRAS